MNEPSEKLVSVVITGFGFMGQTHAKCLAMNPRAVVAGIVDADPAKANNRAAAMGLDAPVGDSLDEMLRSVKAEAVDLCLPTDLHRAQAEVAFAHGKHVFCEKPLALTVDDARAMVGAAEAAGVFLMVGHCIRFWPEYRELERVVRGGELGTLRSLTLTRLAGRPGYTVGEWVADPKRCTGAALDLHIHDADFLHHLLGLPKSVTSCGVRYTSGWDHITTIYDYDGLCVSAEGGWDQSANWGFRMAYHAVFDGGTLDFDSTASPTLMRCTTTGKPEPVIPPAVNIPHPEVCGAYAAELDHFVSCLQRSQPPQMATGAQAAESLRLVLAEIESAASGRTVTL
jgi:predicted dehydrogenase